MTLPFPGGDPHCTSSQGDSPLYLATYGILNSPKGKPDFGALDELIEAGKQYRTLRSREPYRFYNYVRNITFNI